MQPTPRTFTSKVSWRAFVLFVCCALVPLSALALLSLREVSTELRVQTERRLRRASKAVGLELNKRLLGLEAFIGVPEAQTPRLGDEDLPRPFLGVVRVTPDGNAIPVSGRPTTAPPLTPEQLRHLADGHAVLSIVPGDEIPARFFLSRTLARGASGADVLHGEINPDYLWSMEGESSVDYATRIVVIDKSGQVLLSSFEHPAAAAITHRSTAGPSGQFTWNDGTEDYFASYWSLFLQRRYLAPNWVVVLAQPTSDILAPIAVFKRIFVLVALLSLLVVLLLSVGQIRRILQPLDRLLAATRRLALGHLDTRVQVTSGDEFEDLADSFNQMAGQLGRQFDALAMRYELTLTLSRSGGTADILQPGIEILARHLGPAVFEVWMRDGAGATLACLARAGSMPGAPPPVDPAAPAPAEIARVATEGQPCANHSLSAAPAAFVSCHPLRDGGRTLGVLAAFTAHPLDSLALASLASAAEEIAQSFARQRMAAALARSEEQIRQLQKMEAIGRLAGGVAHDFNNLLTVIIGYTQMMLDELPPGDSRLSDLQAVRQTADRAAQLTQQLLAFSRKQVLAPALLDLGAVISGLTAMLRRLVGASIELVFVPAPQPCLVLLDRGQLEQVIMNLVVNARDAMPDGGRITIEATLVAPEAPPPGSPPAAPSALQALLRVSDTGVGMDEGTMARIFEPFFTTKAPGKGTGLGLATVFGIVAQSEGTIHVDSAPGRGTTFSLRFPLAEGSVESRDTRAAIPVRGDETILVVDDEQAVLTLLRRGLSALGYTVLCANRPSDALRLAEQHPGPIHLLLTDMVMPEMNGAMLTERIAALRPGIAALQMSGYTEHRHDASPARGSQPAFLQKPFMPEAVAKAVRAVLDAAMLP